MRTTSLITALVSMLVFAVANTAHAQIVALGASNVAGYGVASSEAFPAQLERMLTAKGYNVQVTNAGISGNTNEQLLSRLDSDVPAGTKIVILDVSGGNYNAQKKGFGDQTGQLTTIAARLRARGIKIIPENGRSIKQKELRQADGRHFTAEGHTLVASRLLPSVIQALRH